jgi:arabinogalactan oligomer/maltooligosaccharide transport system substrate-binding protein
MANTALTALLAVLICAACGETNATETEALNDVLMTRPDEARGVETTLLTFSRGQTMLRRVLESGVDCPDLARIDATWLPGLARAGLLRVAPDPTHELLPEAAELATDEGTLYAVPQSIDGLALVFRKEAVSRIIWPPRTAGELIAGAHRLTTDDTHGLGVRVDGYWFLPFLRAYGADVLDASTGELGIDTPRAAAALDRFAGLFAPDGVAPPPPPSGTAAQDETQRFRSGKLAILINGPWAITDLVGSDTGAIGVAPLPDAPRGGQLFVVPRCARHPSEAWQLAGELTAPRVQADWADRFGLVPTKRSSLEAAGPLAQSFYEALRGARPLPRHPASAELFDDLNPAVAAVVAGDATAEEALAGVARAWTRLMKRYEIEVVPYVPPPADAGIEPTDAGVEPSEP